MSYSFDIIGIAPVLQFFNHQQQLEAQTQSSQTYLGSYCCTLDGFIKASEQVHPKPDWDWDAIVNKMVEFWLSREADVRHWRAQFSLAEGGGHLIVARVVNYASLRREFEQLFDRWGRRTQNRGITPDQGRNYMLRVLARILLTGDNGEWGWAQLIDKAPSFPFTHTPAMDLDELLHRYQAGDRTFTALNLREIDLIGADLRGTDFSASDLRQARLGRSQFRHSWFTRADLSEALLWGADFTGAQADYIQLRDADLSGTVWAEAQLMEANLLKAILRGANLQGANLRGALLMEADLRPSRDHSTDLSGANLQGANLSYAQLSGARLAQANLTAARLCRANLSRDFRPNALATDLSGANLAGADLSYADLRGVRLRGANLAAADLTGALMDQADLTGATRPDGSPA